MNQNRRLARILGDFGLLNIMGAKDERELTQALRAQADALGYDFWRLIISALNDEGRGVVRARPPRNQSTRDYCEAGDLDGFTGCADLVVVDGSGPRIPGLDSDRAEALYGIDEFVKVSDLLELTLPGAIDECETISSLRDLRRETVISAGVTREDLWARYLSPLARLSTDVNIFDRYLFSGLLFPERLPGSVGYLIWLLDSLDQDLPPSASINIYAYTGEKLARDSRNKKAQPFGTEEIAKELRKLSSWNRPGQLNVYLSDTLAHARRIRFSCGHALRLDAGFDQLKFDSGGRLREAISYNYVAPGSSLNQSAEDEENARESGRHWVLRSKKRGFEEVPHP